MKLITLLDLGGVVFQSSGKSNQVINWPLVNALNHKYGHDLNIGLDRFTDFLKEYNAELGLKLSQVEFLEAIFNTLDFNARLVEGIRKYSEIIIVSDNYRENINYISKRYNFKKWSKNQFYSFDFALEKAEPAFFKNLLEKIPDYKASEMLFIDDSLSKLESASISGIRGIHFQSTDQTLEEFEDFVKRRMYDK